MEINQEDDMLLMPTPPVPMRLPTNIFNEPTPTLALNLNGPQSVPPRIITAETTNLLPPKTPTFEKHVGYNSGMP